MNKNFKPNACTYEDGIDRINSALKKTKTNSFIKDQISTSKDDYLKDLLDDLVVTNIPDNFKKWHQLV